MSQYRVNSRPRRDKTQETNSPFKRFRLKAKLSQEQLAREIGVEGRSGFPTMPNRLVGVAVSTIRRWEKGQAEPTMTVSQMKKFCQAIKQNFEELPTSLMPGQSPETEDKLNGNSLMVTLHSPPKKEIGKRTHSLSTLSE